MPDAASDDVLDLDLVAHYRIRYSAMDSEEVQELAGRVESLSDEAAAALLHVLEHRGMSSPTDRASSSIARSDVNPAPAGALPIAEQVAEARRLWRGPTSVSIQVVMATAGFFLGGMLARRLLVTGLFLLLISAAAAYASQSLGRRWTRKICSNGDLPIEQRAVQLRRLMIGVLLAYFVAYAGIAALGR